jgi:N-methylhydantoinase B/oxoprolinase/acetone carboxylase alpha subunit
MSTLVAQTISNGTVSTSSANVIQGSAKAWVQFAGSTATVNGSYNVSSITRNSAGYYTVNFTAAMPNINYSVAGAFSPIFSTRFTGGINLFSNAASAAEIVPTTSSFNFVTTDSSAAPFDPKYTCITVFSS